MTAAGLHSPFEEDPSMKRTFAVALGLLLVAGAAAASNTGFKLNFPLDFTPGLTNSNIVAFPFFYFPNGDVGDPTQDSLDLCFDMNNGVKGAADQVVSVTRFDAGTGSPTTQDCLDTSFPQFPVTPGEGYIYTPAGAGKSVQFDVY
jgi:hypothetical protein